MVLKLKDYCENLNAIKRATVFRVCCHVRRRKIRGKARTEKHTKCKLMTRMR